MLPSKSNSRQSSDHVGSGGVFRSPVNPWVINFTSAFGASASASAYGGAQEQTSQQYTCNRVFSTGRAKKFNGKKINSNRFGGAQEQTSQRSTCKQLFSTVLGGPDPLNI